MKSKLLITMALSLAAVAGCCPKGAPKVPAINLENLSESVAPGEDFYAYATAGWQAAHPLKPEFSRYGSFDILNENNQIRLNDLFKELSGKKTTPGTEEQKIADLYTMGLDSTRLNAEGAAPLLPYIEELEEISDVKSFTRAAAKAGLYGVSSLYGIYVSADLVDNNNQILYLAEDGLAMPNRDYYLEDMHSALREGYVAFLEKVFTLSGVSEPLKAAQDAMEIQMQIAVPYWSMAQQRDIEAQYNPMSTEQVLQAYPNLMLSEYFDVLGIEPQSKMVVEEPSYFEALNAIFATVCPEKLKHYLQAMTITGACGALSDEFSDAKFDFFSRQMAGVQEQKPRWKRAMSLPNSILGEAVGKLYVAEYFPEKDKERMLSIVKNIQASLGEHIDSLDWMSAETKVKAHEKLDNFIIKIGYPDKWKDYSSLNIDPSNSYYDNVRAASRWYSEDNLSKLGKPVDKTEWGMSPQTVNAYYNPTTNEICFPAGILQPPFFNTDADDAVNYGAIGVVISHEMTHGFDDQGRLFDKDGNMNNWWSEADAEAFKAKTAKLVDQFNAVEILPGLMANGAATLGENIADQGGLRIAYTAMENSFGDKRPESLDGFTPEQRFYIAYATVWAQNITKEEMSRLTLQDVHSLGANRVNVTLRNLGTFFDAFSIKEGDNMWRPENERVIIW